ncbi:MAG TPA: hypothetical protein VF589_11930 [Allosphingosinicella sp.]
MKTHLIVGLASLLCLTGAAYAAETPTDAVAHTQSGITLDPGESTKNDGKASNPRDPNAIICKRTTDLGTRLPRKKVCMTRAQHTERRLLDRDMVERSQASRPINER